MHILFTNFLCYNETIPQQDLKITFTKRINKSLYGGMGVNMNHFDRKTELLDGLETDYMRVLYYDFDKKLKEDYKSYEHIRLCTIIEGEKIVKVNNGTEITYNHNDFIILPPYSTVNMEINTPTKALVFEIYDSLIDTVAKKICTESKIDLNCDMNKQIFHEKITPVFKNSVDRILLSALSEAKDKEFLVDLYAQEMTYHLFKMKNVHDILHVNSDNFIQLSIKMMKENIAEGITISEIAFALNMSPANFSVKFKKVLGVTPNDYLTTLKLSEAKKRLKEKNVTEVAYDLGYENISHFISLFKEKFGVTPKQYILSANTS